MVLDWPKEFQLAIVNLSYREALALFEQLTDPPTRPIGKLTPELCRLAALVIKAGSQLSITRGLHYCSDEIGCQAFLRRYKPELEHYYALAEFLIQQMRRARIPVNQDVQFYRGGIVAEKNARSDFYRERIPACLLKFSL